MADLIITVSEENLHSNSKLLKILYECQSQGLISIERVESSPYTLKPSKKPGKEPHKTPLPEDFVRAVKSVVTLAASRNGHTIETIDRGVGSYVFWLNAPAWCSMMDKLLERHRDLIEDMLEKKHKADSVNVLAPFIGAILDEKLFQEPQGIRKVDLIHSFTEYYGYPCASVKTQLSTSQAKPHEFHELVVAAVNIAKEIDE